LLPAPQAGPVGQAAARCSIIKNEQLVTAVQHILELGGIHVTVGTGALSWELCYLAKLKSCPEDQGLSGFLGKTNLIFELGINESETRRLFL